MQGSKAFFFEKKKQKAFTLLSRESSDEYATGVVKVFQKEGLIPLSPEAVLQEESSPFLKKRTKKLLLPRICTSRSCQDEMERRSSGEIKVFCFFSSEKKAFLAFFRRVTQEA